jgi:hypothetical protein
MFIAKFNCFLYAKTFPIITNICLGAVRYKESPSITFSASTSPCYTICNVLSEEERGRWQGVWKVSFLKYSIVLTEMFRLKSAGQFWVWCQSVVSWALNVEDLNSWNLFVNSSSSYISRLQWVQIPLEAWMFVCIYSVCVVLCAGTGPVQRVLPTVYRIMKLKKRDQRAV